MSQIPDYFDENLFDPSDGQPELPEEEPPNFVCFEGVTYSWFFAAEIAQYIQARSNLRNAFGLSVCLLSLGAAVYMVAAAVSLFV